MWGASGFSSSRSRRSEQAGSSSGSARSGAPSGNLRPGSSYLRPGSSSQGSQSNPIDVDSYSSKREREKSSILMPPPSQPTYNFENIYAEYEKSAPKSSLSYFGDIANPAVSRGSQPGVMNEIEERFKSFGLKPPSP